LSPKCTRALLTKNGCEQNQSGNTSKTIPSISATSGKETDDEQQVPFTTEDSRMSVLPDFRLETYLAHWEFNARFHMTASDAESMTLRELLAMASPQDADAFDRLWLGYTQTYGAPPLRDEIARTY